MNHAQNLDLLSGYPIRDYGRESADDELARVFDPALAAQVRIVLKLPYVASDLGKYTSCRSRVLTGDKS